MNMNNKNTVKFNDQLIGLKTLALKEVIRILRIWKQTLLPPVITLTLYFLIFGTLIGSRVGEMDGVSYMAFIVPGLIMMSVITNSYSNVSSSFFGAKFQRSIEEILVSPLSTHFVILGYVFGSMFRGLLVGLIVTLVSLFFSPTLEINNIFIVILTVILTSFVFSLAGLFNGIFAKKFDDVQLVPIFVLTPLTYLGGVFYSLSLLPTFWQVISLFNPILYMVNLFRYGFLGITDINIYIAFGILTLFMIVFYYLVYYMLEKGVGMRN